MKKTDAAVRPIGEIGISEKVQKYANHYVESSKNPANINVVLLFDPKVPRGTNVGEDEEYVHGNIGHNEETGHEEIVKCNSDDSTDILIDIIYSADLQGTIL